MLHVCSIITIAGIGLHWRILQHSRSSEIAAREDMGAKIRKQSAKNFTIDAF